MDNLYNIIKVINTFGIVHGPCGDLNPDSPCMVKDSNGVKRCSKKFPKPYREQTVVNENGYPHYKRSATVPEADRHFITNPLCGLNNQIELDNRYGIYLLNNNRCNTYPY